MCFCAGLVNTTRCLVLSCHLIVVMGVNDRDAHAASSLVHTNSCIYRTCLPPVVVVVITVVDLVC